MSRGVKIPWVVCQNTMDGFDIPWIGGSKYHGKGVQYTISRGVKIP